MYTAFAIFLILGISLVSCKKEDSQPTIDIYGTWELVKLSGSWTGEIIEGEDLDFQERYIFHQDGTFIKYSERAWSYIGDVPEGPFQALGNFEIEPSSDVRFIFELNLIFDTGEEVVANCGQGNQEFLIINPNQELVNTSWAACDGPGFYYHKQTP